MYYKNSNTPLRFLILSIAALSIVISCRPQQYTFDNLPQERLEFGSGGGVAGKVDTYTLLSNGQLFLTNSMTQETQELEGFGKKGAKSFFEKVNQPEISNLEFNHPGNLYYFITHIAENQKMSLVWGSMNHSPPTLCTTLYQDLMATVKKTNP